MVRLRLKFDGVCVCTIDDVAHNTLRCASRGSGADSYNDTTVTPPRSPSSHDRTNRVPRAPHELGKPRSAIRDYGLLRERMLVARNATAEYAVARRRHAAALKSLFDARSAGESEETYSALQREAHESRYHKMLCLERFLFAASDSSFGAMKAPHLRVISALRKNRALQPNAQPYTEAQLRAFFAAAERDKLELVTGQHGVTKFKFV